MDQFKVADGLEQLAAERGETEVSVRRLPRQMCVCDRKHMRQFERPPRICYAQQSTPRIALNLCDQRLGDNDVINFNAGDHSISVSMRYEDYVLVEKPELGAFAA